jgi:predicted secreted protein
MSSAIAAYGCSLKIGATAVAEVTKIEPPALKLDTVDVTSHGSTGGWKEFVGTLKDGGQMVIDINYVPTAATHKNSSGGLIFLLANGTLQAFSLVFSDVGATTWTFSAFVVDFKASAPVDGKLSAVVTFKLSGQPTLV